MLDKNTRNNASLERREDFVFLPTFMEQVLAAVEKVLAKNAVKLS